MSDDDLLEVDLPPSPFQIVWHAPGEKVYFSGVDRGVLYPETGPGVPWNGLVSVDEKINDGGIDPFYMDGIRRRNDQYLGEFSATISAFSSPNEFARCEGEIELAMGLYLGQQPRESFGFSYRTFIGNDLGGSNAHYQVHLVYQAMTSAADRSHESLSDDPEAEMLSWDVETVPVDVFGVKPSAHIKLDTRRVDPARLLEIEGILYGYSDYPRLPDIQEVYDIITRIDPPEDDGGIPWEPEPTP